MENFPPKVENFRPLQNVSIHIILQKNFLQLFESGKLSTKAEKFPLCIFGLEFDKREGPEPENKISTKRKIFYQKWENSHLCRMFQFMWFWNKNFFLEIFRGGKFFIKVERVSKLITPLARLARALRSQLNVRGFETHRSSFLMLAYVFAPMNSKTKMPPPGFEPAS